MLFLLGRVKIGAFMQKKTGDWVDRLFLIDIGDSRQRNRDEEGAAPDGGAVEPYPASLSFQQFFAKP
jgi:hypothetical protein